ncbi:MAG: adenylate/guanylate cyclase domain-containing protein, partial [Actinomycetota bacterium]|nr:adenylate/guanylate cyclase domain-containing protein [Actinomycetota bacterium]
MTGDIQYARSGGVAIAYKVIGDGDVDLVYVPDYVSNLVYDWEYPRWRAFAERMARSFRLILFDKRGTGLSDHGGQFASLETRMEDLRAVLDAVGSSSPVVFAAQEGCGMATLFAATYPERLRALVLFHASWLAEADADVLQELRELRERWGTQEYSDFLLEQGCKALAGNQDDRRWFANSLRVGASPEVAYALNRAFSETDLTEVFPAVRVPTLVLYREPWESDALALSARIQGSQAMRISGDDYFPIYLSPDAVDEIERFVAGEPAPTVPDSVLATVMFTDIVGSTERAAALGDRGWRDLLEQHHALVRRELGRYRGKERDTAGDGFFATFDGPARAIRAAQSIVGGMNELGLEPRIGIHVGECELHDDKVAGIAVNIGARVAGEAGANEILVSQTVRDLVAGTGITFDDRGGRELKGIPGTWQLFAAR